MVLRPGFYCLWLNFLKMLRTDDVAKIPLKFPETLDEESPVDLCWEITRNGAPPRDATDLARFRGPPP